MIDDWGVVVLFSLGAGSLQGWIASTYTTQSGLFMGLSFLIVAVYFKRKKERVRAGG